MEKIMCKKNMFEIPKPECMECYKRYDGCKGAYHDKLGHNKIQEKCNQCEHYHLNRLYADY